MNVDSVSAPRFLGMRPAVAAGLVIAVTTIFRFFYSVWLPILPDESYYFQWSRHLDASYFSKGPAVAYTIAAGTAIFGANSLGVRFFAVMLSAGTAWQVFLLARRWFDDTTGLIAVLLTGVVPIYAVGAVVMTIDPLSAFFWVWAANLFSRAMEEDRLIDWLLTGLAVGSGFLAKYLNAMELVAFLAFLLTVPARQRFLARPHFWLMLLVATVCTAPVWWWNWRHHWVSAAQLGNRGHLNGPFDLHFSSFLNFLGLQALVVSPLLFLALLAMAVGPITRWKDVAGRDREGERLLLLLFLSVFLLYAVLAFHLKEEPNWPAVSYLTLIILLAARWRARLAANAGGYPVMISVFVLAWAQTLLLHDTQFLPLPQRMDPLGRAAGWSEIAARLAVLRREQRADVVIADAYKEASIFSFLLPDQYPIYTVRNAPPANQFDFWPGYPTASPHRALWIAGDYSTPEKLRRDFNTITFLEREVVSFRGKPFRVYTVYLCENR